MKLKPLGNNVVIKISTTDKTESGLFLSSAKQMVSDEVEIIDPGNSGFEKGTKMFAPLGTYLMYKDDIAIIDKKYLCAEITTTTTSNTTTGD